MPATDESYLGRKPLPLTTVELQKAGSRLLKLAPKRVLDVSGPVLFVFLNLDYHLCFLDRRKALSAGIPLIPSDGNRSVRSSI